MIIPVDNTNVQQAGIIHSESWQESHRSFCTTDFIELHTPERQTRYIEEKMDAGSKFFMLVDDEPVGVVSITDNVIEDLYVLPRKQGRGYGTELLQFAIRRCVGTPRLWVLENNGGAMRLYRRMGFKENGRVNEIVPGTLCEIEFELSE